MGTSEESASAQEDVNVHYVSRTGDLEALLAAYLGGQDLMVPDAKGNTPLHIAARYDQRSIARGIMALSMPQTAWNVKNNDGQTPGDIAAPRIKKDIRLISMKAAEIMDQHTSVNKRLIQERLQNPNEHHKVLLSIDGGGIKAVLIMGTLLAIERELGEPIMSRIHWLGGTSCGGIISLCLGVGFGCDQARKMFMAGRKDTFCGNKCTFPKHASTGIESSLKKNLGPHTKMADIKTHRIMVTAAKVKAAPPALVLFRTYAPKMCPQEFERYGYLNPENVLVWKAARSTSAAPVYFESFHGLADGAIFCNNPCITLMTDFLRLKKLENFKGISNQDEIGCIISLGSGSEPTVPIGSIDVNLKSKMAINKYWDVFGKGKNLMTLFLYQCTSSHAVSAGQAREWAHSMNVPYFRLSPRLSRDFELDTIALDAVFDFMFENEVYLRTQMKHEVQEIAKLLKSMPKNKMQVIDSTVN